MHLAQLLLLYLFTQDAYNEPQSLTTTNASTLALHVGGHSCDQSRLAEDPRLAHADPSTSAPSTSALPTVQSADTNVRPVVSTQDAQVPTRFLDYMARNIAATNKELSVMRSSIRTIIQRHDSTEDVRDIHLARGRTRGNSWDSLPDNLKKQLQVRLR